MLANNILGWLIHPKLKQSVLELSSAKAIASTGIIAAVTVPFYAIFYFILGHPYGALACILIGIFLLFALLILKFLGFLDLARELIVSTVYLGLTWLSYSQGGLDTPATFWLVLPPIMAVFLGGLRSGFYWLLTSILTVVGFYGLQINHIHLPFSPINNILLLMTASISGLACVILAFIYYFEMAKREGFQKLEKAARIIEEKSDALSQVNQELKTLASRTHAILTAAADGIITTNKDGVIDNYNRAASEMFGYDSEELINQKLQMLFAPTHILQHASSENTFSLAYILNMENILHELEGFRKDGSSFPLELAVSKVEYGNDFLYIFAIRDITERKKTEARLAYLAHYDHLTNLPNRTLYEILLNKAITRAKRSGKLCALLYLDLDYFKNVNDTLGHDIGDLLLKEAANRIHKCLRECDTVARLGGDEFTVILDEIVEIAHAAKVGKMILDILNPPFILKGYEIFTSASIGIAIYPTNGHDSTTLTKHADMALYTAKEKGRRNYQFFNAELNSQNLSRIALENNLHNALRLNELQVYYQPQIDIKSGQIIGIEALLRWQNPTLGFVAPDTFIPIAEKIGLIGPISEWVIKTACQQFKQWQQAGLVNHLTKISLNLSSSQLKQENLATIITQILQQTGTAPENIELELTETAIMHDQKSSITILQELNKLGVCIAIDDFGTGYSSLSYLKCLPVHTLKIDKNFVRDLTTDNNDAMIIKAIIALGHGLELKVLAEGVETAAQYNYLQANNCDQIQGYYISVPLSAEGMTVFLSTRN
jgi:diguanylate cyclase (GGDEF)-like protein/PAS domain S-box-containing protein